MTSTRSSTLEPFGKKTILCSLNSAGAAPVETAALDVTTGVLGAGGVGAPPPSDPAGALDPGEMPASLPNPWCDIVPRSHCGSIWGARQCCPVSKMCGRHTKWGYSGSAIWHLFYRHFTAAPAANNAHDCRHKCSCWLCPWQCKWLTLCYTSCSPNACQFYLSSLWHKCSHRSFSGRWQSSKPPIWTCCQSMCWWQQSTRDQHQSTVH